MFLLTEISETISSFFSGSETETKPETETDSSAETEENKSEAETGPDEPADDQQSPTDAGPNEGSEAVPTEVSVDVVCHNPIGLSPLHHVINWLIQ